MKTRRVVHFPLHPVSSVSRPPNGREHHVIDRFEAHVRYCRSCHDSDYYDNDDWCRRGYEYACEVTDVLVGGGNRQAYNATVPAVLFLRIEIPRRYFAVRNLLGLYEQRSSRHKSELKVVKSERDALRAAADLRKEGRSCEASPQSEDHSVADDSQASANVRDVAKVQAADLTNPESSDHQGNKVAGRTAASAVHSASSSGVAASEISLNALVARLSQQQDERKLSIHGEPGRDFLVLRLRRIKADDTVIAWDIIVSADLDTTIIPDETEGDHSFKSIELFIGREHQVVVPSMRKAKFIRQAWVQRRVLWVVEANGIVLQTTDKIWQGDDQMNATVFALSASDCSNKGKQVCRGTSGNIRRQRRMDFTSGIIFDRNDSRENRILELAPSGVKQSESQRKRKMKLALPIQDSRRFAQIVPDGQMPRLAAEEARMSSERSMTGADLTTPKTSDQRASEEGLEDLPDMSAQTIDGVEALYDDDQEL